MVGFGVKRGLEGTGFTMILSRLNHRILFKKYRFPLMNIDRNSS